MEDMQREIENEQRCDSLVENLRDEMTQLGQINQQFAEQTMTIKKKQGNIKQMAMKTQVLKPKQTMAGISHENSKERKQPNSKTVKNTKPKQSPNLTQFVNTTEMSKQIKEIAKTTKSQQSKQKSKQGK